MGALSHTETEKKKKKRPLVCLPDTFPAEKEVGWPQLDIKGQGQNQETEGEVIREAQSGYCSLIKGWLLFN